MINVSTFQDLGLTHKTLGALEIKGFTIPSPIQSKVIPILLQGTNDIIGQAETGTGKTAAFALPIIERIVPGADGPQVLVMVPTRELAIQVSEEFKALSSQKDLRVLSIYGGQPIQTQFSALRKGVDVMIGTPGRMKDHLQRKSFSLKNVSHLVLDEADEMLSMGFIEDVEFILEYTPKDKRTLLFSATMSNEILRLAKTYMTNTERVVAPKPDCKNNLIDQVFYEVAAKSRFEALCRIIEGIDDFYGVVFCKTRREVEDITKHLQSRELNAEGVHGDIQQKSRERVLKDFKDRRKTILVATDVAARGIDVQNLTHVINYGTPQNIEAYIHRIGRTGRAGKKGIAINIISPQEFKKLEMIKRVTNSTMRKETLPSVQDIITSKNAKIKEKIEALISSDEHKKHLSLAEEILGTSGAADAVAALLNLTFGKKLEQDRFPEVHEPEDRRSRGSRQDRSSSSSYGDRDRKKSFGKPKGDRPFGKPDGERSFGKPKGDRPFGKPNGDRPFGKPNGDRPFGKPKGDRPFGKPKGDRPFSKPNGDRPFSDRFNAKSNDDRPFKKSNEGSFRDRPKKWEDGDKPLSRRSKDFGGGSGTLSLGSDKPRGRSDNKSQGKPFFGKGKPSGGGKRSEGSSGGKFKPRNRD